MSRGILRKFAWADFGPPCGTWEFLIWNPALKVPETRQTRITAYLPVKKLLRLLCFFAAVPAPFVPLLLRCSSPSPSSSNRFSNPCSIRGKKTPRERVRPAQPHICVFVRNAGKTAPLQDDGGPDVWMLDSWYWTGLREIRRPPSWH